MRDLQQAQKGNSCLFHKGGNDVIVAGQGEDTAEFSGGFVEYDVAHAENKTIGIDKVPDRDGTDELTDIEILKF
jgi:hypothetical protein